MIASMTSTITVLLVFSVNYFSWIFLGFAILQGWWKNEVTIGNLLTLVGICATVVSAIIGGAWYLGTKLSKIETVLEVAIPHINKRLDRLEQAQDGETSVGSKRR